MKTGMNLDEKIKNAKAAAKDAATKIGNGCVTAAVWVAGNPQTWPIITGAVATVFGYVTKTRNAKRETDLKELYVYDRRLGMYHKLRRPLTSQQAIAIDTMRANGQTLAEALDELHLI